jgi:hypothetical protein
LPDAHWFDPGLRTWRDRRGRPAHWPDLEEMARQRVVLAAAHVDHDPRNNRMRNFASLCRRCHLLHDRAWHLLQRWITYRRRYASADCLIGPYRHGRDAAATPAEIAIRIAERRSTRRAEAGSRLLHR